MHQTSSSRYRMVVKNFAGSADDVEKMVNLVQELLDKGQGSKRLESF